MGRYSNHADQGTRITRLLEIVPEATETPKPRTVKRVHRRLRVDVVDDLVAGYEAGLTVRQLADQFDIGRSTVSKILSRQGVPTRHQGLTPSETEAAAELYCSGLSLVQVANRIGVSRGAINNALVRAGVQLRPRRGWRYDAGPFRDPNSTQQHCGY